MPVSGVCSYLDATGVGDEENTLKIMRRELGGRFLTAVRMLFRLPVQPGTAQSGSNMPSPPSGQEPGLYSDEL